MSHRLAINIAVALALATIPAESRGQGSPAGAPKDSASTLRRDTTDAERRARLARRGGGVRVGMWRVRGLAMPSGVSSSETPSFEGYVRKGLDEHLALKNSIGFWRQRQSTTTTDPLGGTTRSTLDAYIVPQYTSLIFFPFTKPEQRFEPYLRGGAGFTLGVEDQQGDGGSVLGSGGTVFVAGFGATGGLGLEWRPAEAVGLAVAGRYQWNRFFQDFAGERTYQGLAADLGITYRFQFR
jgi:hypothetical protein